MTITLYGYVLFLVILRNFKPEKAPVDLIVTFLIGNAFVVTAMWIIYGLACYIAEPLNNDSKEQSTNEQEQ